MAQWRVGDITITTVHEPDFEFLVPQDAATTTAVLAHAWLAPFVTREGVLRVSTSAVLIETASRVVVVDPWLAFDDPDRASPSSRERMARRLDALAAVGVKTDDVDFVVNSHIDGIGSNTTPVGDGTEIATFPNARYFIPAAELQALDQGRRGGAEPIGAVRDRLGELIDDEISLVAAPGHTAGHTAVQVTSNGANAFVIGHMFLHPAVLLDPTTALLDEDPGTNRQTRMSFLERGANQRALLLGPLFAPPGGGYVERDGNAWRVAA